MVSADGPEAFARSRLSTTLLLPDAALGTAVMPGTALEPGQMREADLSFEAEVAELTPGEAVLQLQHDDGPAVFAAV